MPEMGEPVSEVHIERESNMGKWILLALAIIYVAGSLYLTFSLRAHVETLSKDYAASKVQIDDVWRVSGLKGTSSNDVVVQDLCPLDVSDHVLVGTVDRVAFHEAANALDPAHATPTTCVNLVTGVVGALI